MDTPVINHRSAKFAELGKAVLQGSQKIFKTAGPVIIFPSSGHRRLGSLHRQYLVARRQGIDG
jgi:aspartate aminotransferase-like enzyme